VGRLYSQLIPSISPWPPLLASQTVLRRLWGSWSALAPLSENLDAGWRRTSIRNYAPNYEKIDATVCEIPCLGFGNLALKQPRSLFGRLLDRKDDRRRNLLRRELERLCNLVSEMEEHLPHS